MAPENGGKMAVGETWRGRQKDFFCGKNLWLAFIAGNSFKAIPHNSKCRYGERGATDAKPKAQIILDAAKVSAASGGNSEPKQGQRSQSARGFCPRSTMRVPQPDIIEHFGNADAVPQLPERCLSRKAGIVRCCLNLSSRGEAQRPFFAVRISVCKRIWLEIGTVEISGWKEMPSASRKIEKIDKIFSVRTSAWRSVRKQKRKRAEVTVLYGIVEKYVKNLCIRRRWVTREYERRKMRALFFTA